MNRSSRDNGTLDGGRLLAGLGGALLLTGLFLDWYSAPGLGEGVSAFTVFEIVDLILALIAVTAIFLALEPFTGSAVELRGRDRILHVVGPAAFLIVGVSLVNEPPAARGADLEAGAWLSLAGAAIICAGALLSGNRISLVIAPRDRSATATPHGSSHDPRRPQDPPPERPLGDETETRPLPPR